MANKNTPGTGHRSILNLILFQPEQLMKGYDFVLIIPLC